MTDHLEELHKERHDMCVSGDGETVDGDVVTWAHVSNAIGNNVGVTLDLHQDRFSVRKVGTIPER